MLGDKKPEALWLAASIFVRVDVTYSQSLGICMSLIHENHLSSFWKPNVISLHWCQFLV